MSHQTSGMHHIHTRKRIHIRHEEFPSKNRLKNFLDHAMYFIGMLSPIMVIPQVYKIWVDKNADSVSALSWGTFAIVSLFWILYGSVHKEKLIIFIHACLFFMNSLVVFLTFLY